MDIDKYATSCPLFGIFIITMSSWVTFQEAARLDIEPPPSAEWPESEQDEGYDAERPWRLRRYDPYNNNEGFDDDIVAQLEQLKLPVETIYATATYNQLVRFAHVRQTRFKGPPNRDGSNTNFVLSAADGRRIETNGSPSLRHMWKCYAAILRAIHREGQIRGGIGGSWIYEPWDELAAMMRTYPERLERIEDERVGGRTFNNQIMPGFEWLYTFGEHLVQMGASLQAIVTWAKEVRVDPRDYFHQVSHTLLSPCHLATMLMLTVVGNITIAANGAASGELES